MLKLNPLGTPAISENQTKCLSGFIFPATLVVLVSTDSYKGLFVVSYRNLNGIDRIQIESWLIGIEARLISVLNYTRFENTGDLYNLIGSQQCDLITNRTTLARQSENEIIKTKYLYRKKTV